MISNNITQEDYLPFFTGFKTELESMIKHYCPDRKTDRKHLITIAITWYLDGCTKTGMWGEKFHKLEDYQRAFHDEYYFVMCETKYEHILSELNLLCIDYIFEYDEYLNKQLKKALEDAIRPETQAQEKWIRERNLRCKISTADNQEEFTIDTTGYVRDFLNNNPMKKLYRICCDINKFIQDQEKKWERYQKEIELFNSKKKQESKMLSKE